MTSGFRSCGCFGMWVCVYCALGDALWVLWVALVVGFVFVLYGSLFASGDVCGA